jgi:hypothetical protein
MIGKFERTAARIAADERDYRGRQGVARIAQARGKVDARRAARRAEKAECDSRRDDD